MNLKNNQQGFTLLEILIAITLTSLVLGSLFVLQSNSSKLAFKADTKIYDNISLRAALNTALLANNNSNFSDEILKDNHYQITNVTPLEKPENQSHQLKWQLEKFDIVDDQNNILISSIRFKKLEK